MKCLVLAVTLLVAAAYAAVDTHEHNKIVCFWNSTSFERTGPGKFNIDDLRPALSHCTHLVYGFAGINTNTKEAFPLNPSLDTGAGYGHYKLVTQLKKSFPDVKFILSIGGDADAYEETHKYLTVTETSEARTRFINSLLGLLNDYDFDGVDLAWQFPLNKVPTTRSGIGKFWGGIKRVFGYGKFHDDKPTEHRDGFTALVRDLKQQLRARNNKLLSVTVLPHINASTYYDARLLAPNVDFVNLLAFDQKNPDRNPKEADYPAPIYESYGRTPDDNIDNNVKYWLGTGMPGNKIVVGIPTFARTWKLTEDSQISGVPPVTVDGPGAGGPHTQIPGLLSYAEVCSKLTETAVGRLRPVRDPSKKYGNYAYKPYDKRNDVEGIWVGHEDPDTAGNKATYVKSKALGGVAIYELSLDDFRGSCTGDKYPIVQGAKLRL